jgi:predicted amino acid dehydrogenase
MIRRRRKRKRRRKRMDDVVTKLHRLVLTLLFVFHSVQFADQAALLAESPMSPDAMVDNIRLSARKLIETITKVGRT